MKRIWKQLGRRRAEVAAHPFFTWLQSDALPLEQRFIFSPVMIDFIMGFADMNKWFLCYPDAQSDRERAINEHTLEDRTHSRFFCEDWYSLDLSDVSSWPPGKMLWWLFNSNSSATVREFGMEILDIAVNYPDTFVRFSMMEAIEICGDVFFTRTAKIATRLSERDGAEHRYYGEFHRARETGHLHADESSFVGVLLSQEQHEQASLATNRVFDNFLGVLDEVLTYAQRASANTRRLMDELDHEYQAVLAPRELAATRLGKPGAPRVSPSQAQLVELLKERTARLRHHPFLDWLRTDQQSSALEKLQRFVALWGVDITGYKDFNELVLRYPSPGSVGEHAINRWTQELATHGLLYLRDWIALDMDRALGWDAGETVMFYFLSDETEVHRHNMASVKKHAFRNKQPLLRFWLMYALEESGEPLFECTRAIAEAAEQQHGIALDYWANRHSSGHEAASIEAEQMKFLELEIAAADASTARDIINLIFDNMEQQFSLSLQCAESGLLVQAVGATSPRRTSYFALRGAALAEAEAEAEAKSQKTA